MVEHLGSAVHNGTMNGDDLLLLPPQAASMAAGAIRDMPVITSGQVSQGRRMKATLSCDRRAVDGLMGAQFLKGFKRQLEHPQELDAARS